MKPPHIGKVRACCGGDSVGTGHVCICGWAVWSDGSAEYAAAMGGRMGPHGQGYLTLGIDMRDVSEEAWALS